MLVVVVKLLTYPVVHKGITQRCVEERGEIVRKKTNPQKGLSI